MELVTTEPYKGSRVREVSANDVREAYVVRAALEDLAGRLAAPHFKGNVAPLREEATAIRSAARKNDLEAYTLHDVNFHRAIVAGAANRILLRTWDSLAFEVRIQLGLSRGKVDLVEVQQAHWRIIDALEKGAGPQAGRLLHEHISSIPS
jgi:DNA-binding GntR family transcriptional regulator